MKARLVANASVAPSRLLRPLTTAEPSETTATARLPLFCALWKGRPQAGLVFDVEGRRWRHTGTPDIMLRYLSRKPRKIPKGTRIVHNVYPGPPEDPGRDRPLREAGFRIWLTDAEMGERCHCGWLGGREHYGTSAWVDADGVTRRMTLTT